MVKKWWKLRIYETKTIKLITKILLSLQFSD